MTVAPAGAAQGDPCFLMNWTPNPRSVFAISLFFFFLFTVDVVLVVWLHLHLHWTPILFFLPSLPPPQLLVQFVQNASIPLVQGLEDSDSKHSCLPLLAPAESSLCSPLELTGAWLFSSKIVLDYSRLVLVPRPLFEQDRSRLSRQIIMENNPAAAVLHSVTPRVTPPLNHS